jgi:hypothetical protein
MSLGIQPMGGLRRDVERDASTSPDAPVVRVRAFGLVGGVSVRVGR